MEFIPANRPIISRGVERIGLPTANEETRQKRTFIIAQIDGLSEAGFQRALRARRFPFLSRMLRESKAVAGPWRAHVPTSTSAFQAGLFYGIFNRIPGFFWFDRERQRRMRMNTSEDTSWVEEHLTEQVKPFTGLLTGGSSYSALFTGGADNTFFTFSRLFSPRLNLSHRKGWIYLFLLSQIFLVFRIAYYSAIEIVLSLVDVVRSAFRRYSPLAELKFLFPRIASVVVVREIATLATILDIYRGVGPIYLNYFSYDEHAHYRGPNSTFAYWTLRGLDASIKRIYRATERARRMGIRDYDLYVLSDHGQVRAYPFAELFEQSPAIHFNQLFRALYGGSSNGSGIAGLTALRRRRMEKASTELHESEVQRAETIMAPIPGFRLLSKLFLRPPKRKLERQFGSPMPEALQFVSTGPVAHICISNCKQPVTYEEMRECYPAFLDVLARHEGVGMALCRTKSGGCKISCRGKWFDLGSEHELAQHAPASAMEVLRRHQQELIRLANLEWAGDLVLVGFGRADHRVISYSLEHGSHSGISPEETTPFLLVPARCARQWPELTSFDRINRIELRDLHERLLGLYGHAAEQAISETGAAKILSN